MNGFDHRRPFFLADPNEPTSASRVDFIIIRPYPLAIEVMTRADRSSRSKAKRLLFERIALSERFGPALPLIVVLSESAASDAPIPFVDAALTVRHLPSLADLRERLVVSPVVRDLLHRGAPRDTHFTDGEGYRALWSDALALEDVAYASDPVSDTLVAKLHDICRSYLESSNVQPPRWSASNTLADTGFASEQLDLLLRSGPWFHAFEAAITDAIRQALRTVERTERVSVPAGDDAVNMRYGYWESHNGRRFVVRLLPSRQMFLRHRIPELAADAWIMRAFIRPELDRLIVLPGVASHGDRPASARYPQGMVPLEVINGLEAAGWRAFPWDFGSPEPAFITYLRHRMEAR